MPLGPARRILLSIVSKGAESVLLDEAMRFKPDVVFVIKGIHIPATTLRKLKDQIGESKLINFNPDSPWEPLNSSRQLLASIPIYDHHFTWNRGSLGRFQATGARSASHLPFAYDAKLHHPVEVERTQEFDAIFIGTFDSHRDKLLAELSGCNIGIWGNGWKRASLIPKSWIQSEAVYGEAATRLLARSVCALNILRPQNEGSHNMRTFEIPATGSTMVTTRSAEQSQIFVEGEEMLSYTNSSELKNIIQDLNQNPDKAMRIGSAGLRRVRPETYAARALQILSELGIAV